MPGPGHYDNPEKERQKGPVFGNTQRSFSKNLDETPGPGAYTIRSRAVEGVQVYL